ncbi:MAG: ribonuclease Z [Anaerolineales bacterium]
MKITVLGAGTCIPHENFSTAGYLVMLDGFPLLLDAGPGTIARMAAHGVSYQELDVVLITHLHPDHVLDLLTLLQANNATPGWSRQKSLTIIGCQGIQTFLEAQFRLFDGLEPETYSLKIYEMGAELINFESWNVTSVFSMHTPASLAYRISHQGKALVYSGDAASPDNLTHLAREASLLLCECSLPRGWETADHLSPQQIGILAQKARVERVVLTHRYPQSIEADVVSDVKAYFDGEVMAAIDGWSTEV